MVLTLGIFATNIFTLVRKQQPFDKETAVSSILWKKLNLTNQHIQKQMSFKERK